MAAEGMCWEKVVNEPSPSDRVPQLLAVCGRELRGASWRELTGRDAVRYTSAWEHLLRAVVHGLGGVVGLDLLSSGGQLSVRLLVGCGLANGEDLPWSPDQQLERFRLEVARAFAFERFDLADHLDVLRSLGSGIAFEPAVIQVSHETATATAVLPLEMSFRGMGTVAQILDSTAGNRTYCIRMLVVPAIHQRPDPASIMDQLADAHRLSQDPGVPFAVAYRAHGVRQALQRALDCWLGQHCAMEIQVRSDDLADASRLVNVVRDELARPKGAELSNDMGRRPRLRIETLGGELPDLYVPPTISVLRPEQLMAAPVPSYWASGVGERPRHLATTESAASLITPPLPTYCNLRSVATVVVEDRVSARPELWMGDAPIGRDSSNNSISLDDDVLSRHVHVMGVPGSGKTTVLRRMVLGDLARDRGFVVLDPHSDLSRRVVSDMDSRLSDDSHAGIHSSQPFPGLRVLSAGSAGEAAVERDIGVIIETIEATLPPDYTGPRFRQIARAVLTLHAHVGVGEALVGAKDYMEDPAKLTAALHRFDGPNWVRTFFRSHQLLSESDRASVEQWFTSKLTDFFSTRAAQHLFGTVGQGITATELADGDTKLVIDFGAMQSSIQDAGFLGQLFVAILLRDLVAGGPRLDRRFVLYVDEVQLFFGPSVDRALQEGRKYGLSVVAAHQTSTQLRPQRFDALMGQVGLELLFRCSMRDSQILADRLHLEADALAALPDFQCWVAGTMAQQRGGPFLITTSL